MTATRAKPKRENFSKSVKQKLATNAGNKCSHPSCDLFVSFRSAEKPDGITSFGEAAHIQAASKGKGARRRLQIGTTAAYSLNSYENGVWLCKNHHGWVDGDEVSYTVPMLIRWREIAEMANTVRATLNKDVSLGEYQEMPVPLAEVDKKISSQNAVKEIFAPAIENSCIARIWGKDVGRAVKDIVCELALNEFSASGKATELTLEIKLNSVIFKGNGNPFSHKDLLLAEKQQGGASAIKKLAEFSNRLIVTYQRLNNTNQTTISFIVKANEALGATTCAILHTKISPHMSPLRIASFKTCSALYVVIPPSDHPIPSDAFFLKRYLETKPFGDINLIAVVENTSDETNKILETIPNCKVMNVGPRRA